MEGLGTRSGGGPRNEVRGNEVWGGPGNEVRGMAGNEIRGRSGGGPGKEVRGRAWEQGLAEGLGARLRFSHCVAYITPGAFEHRSAVLRGTQKLLITQTSKV